VAEENAELLAALTAELGELRHKMAKLAVFKGLAGFQSVSPPQRQALLTQFDIMRAYARVLEQRIALTGDDNANGE
jgi:hypothetical protein